MKHPAFSALASALVFVLGACTSAGGDADGGDLRAPADGGPTLRFTAVRPAQAGAPNLFGLYALGQDQFIAVGSQGTILRAAPAPEAPDPTTSDDPPPLVFTPMDLPADLPQPGGRPADFMAVSGTGPTEIYAVTLGGGDGGDGGARQGGLLLRYDGKSWQRELPKDAKGMPAALTSDLLGVFAYKDGAIAVGQGGVWLRRGATGWVVAAQALPAESLSDVYGTAGNDVFAVGGNGAAFRFDGSNWGGASPNGFTGKLAGLFGTGKAGADLYAVGLGGAVLRRSGNQLVDYGARVDPRCGGAAVPRAFLRHGAVTPGGRPIIVGWDGVTLRLREGPCGDAGTGLAAFNETGATPNRLEAALALRSRRLSGDRTTVYLAGAEGVILRAEWEEQ